MPKSVILRTSHNEQFQKFRNPISKLLEIWDLQNVTDLFGMPTCVLFAQKGLETTYPVKLKIFIPSKPNKENQNENNLYNIDTSTYHPPNVIKNISYYYDKFKVGASIFPRNLYFVQIDEQNESYLHLYIDPSINSIAKNQWKDISVQGVIHEKYLFCTLLAWELVPFGYTKLRLIALPISISDKNEITIVQFKDMDKESKKWFETINSIWNENNTETSKKRFPTLTDRLNYNNLLVKQVIQKYIVLYSGTGTNICASVIDRDKIGETNNKQVQFIPDVKTWIFETESEEEAHYLTAILNSSHLNELIKPLQPQGLGGGRAIHRRPLQFPIPKFTKENQQHRKLAELSSKAHELISSYSKQKIIKNRKEAREIVKIHLQQINELVIDLLKEKINKDYQENNNG